MHSPIAATSIESLIIDVRGERVLLDADVAALYGVETRAVNQAVRRNLDKFPNGYILELTSEESAYLREAKDSRSQIVILNSDNKKQGRVGNGRHTKYNYKAFTEKGLYMLATILKSERATAATLAIIETFAKVRELKRELVALHAEKDKKTQGGKLKHFGELLADVVMPDLTDVETESSLELNFLVGKIKHTVRRIKRKLNPPND
ncbi:MAG: ORF6N domain-containing protein [Kiritimatiellae bacterium]|nr:ORF6N domain-containing protein [Kiritimatiellia bacterium]